MSGSSGNSSALLPASLQNAMRQVMDRANLSGAGIRACLLSTTEGVPLGRVVQSHDYMNEDVLASIESVWAPASKQLPVLGLGKVKQVTAVYDHGTLIHVYQAPVVVTILCGNTVHNNSQSQQQQQPINLGSVRTTAIPLLKQVLEPLCTTLVNSLQPATDHLEGLMMLPPGSASSSSAVVSGTSGGIHQ